MTAAFDQSLTESFKCRSLTAFRLDLMTADFAVEFAAAPFSFQAKIPIDLPDTLGPITPSGFGLCRD